MQKVLRRNLHKKISCQVVLYWNWLIFQRHHLVCAIIKKINHVVLASQKICCQVVLYWSWLILQRHLLVCAIIKKINHVLLALQKICCQIVLFWSWLIFQRHHLWRKQSQSNKNKKSILTPQKKYIFIMGTQKCVERCNKKKFGTPPLTK